MNVFSSLQDMFSSLYSTNLPTSGNTVGVFIAIVVVVGFGKVVMYPVTFPAHSTNKRKISIDDKVIIMCLLVCLRVCVNVRARARACRPFETCGTSVDGEAYLA